jgi:hypothetical protein
MSRISKTILMTAAGATLLAANPALARDGWHGDRRHDGVSAGDVIAGALIIGGIAAIAASASNNRSYGSYDYDREGYRRGWGYDGYNNGYNNGYINSRTAVDQCVRAAQREARRYGWARVTDVTSIDSIRGGYEIRGRLVVEQRGYNGWRGGDDRYGYHYDRYGNDYDKGRFSCKVRYGGIEDVRIGGLRGSY